MLILSTMKFVYRLQILLLLFVITVVPGHGANKPLIAIMSHQEAQPYQQTVASFKQSLEQSLPQVEFLHPDIEAEGNDLPAPTLVFALGSKAVQTSREKWADREILATMVLNNQILQDLTQATGVLLKTSAHEQLQWHQRFLPQAKRIGILYDPKYNQQWVDSAKIAAGKLDLEIVAIPVRSAKDLPSALKSLSRTADSILGIADKTVYSGKTAKAVLLFSFRNRIPFVGLSSAWVKAGALYALAWDYPKLGQQCAAIALRILNGEKAGTIPPQLPDKPVYLLNLKTAKHMKLDFSQELIRGASKVYE